MVLTVCAQSCVLETDEEYTELHSVQQLLYHLWVSQRYLTDTSVLTSSHQDSMLDRHAHPFASIRCTLQYYSAGSIKSIVTAASHLHSVFTTLNFTTNCRDRMCTQQQQNSVRLFDHVSNHMTDERKPLYSNKI